MYPRSYPEKSLEENEVLFRTDRLQTHFVSGKRKNPVILLSSVRRRSNYLTLNSNAKFVFATAIAVILVAGALTLPLAFDDHMADAKKKK
ncbi:MAG: hypothetical protein WB612_02770 [Nitrososphaeraceae archaeon]